jgi:UDP-galactopyranose mutase
MSKIPIVGAGFSGAVLAQQVAKHADDEILVVDERSHVGAHCHTERLRLTRHALVQFRAWEKGSGSQRVVAIGCRQ